MRKLIPCLLIAGIVAIAGCKKESTAGGPGVVAADAPLTYVPADTPYVFANIDPVPADVTAVWIDKMDKAFKIGDMYATQIDVAEKAIRDQAAKDAEACASSSGGGGSTPQDASSGHDDADADKSANADAPQVSGTGDAASGSDAATADSAQAGASGDGNTASATPPANCAQANTEREKSLKLLDAVKAEVAGKDIKGLMDLLGVDTQTHVAFYGIGLVPVIRGELAKPDNLRATIARIETASGSKMAAGKVGGLDYWIVEGDKPDAPVHGVIAISGKQLVATIAPAKASDADMRILLGLDKPAKSLADSGDLAALNKRMNYLSYTSGYIDSGKLVAVLKAPATPLETAFLAAMGEKQKPAIDAVCAAEYDQIAAAWPRASLGYTDASAKHMAVRGVIETRADIAKDLMSLRAPMPGMQLAQDSLFDFGISMNLTRLPDLAVKYADATSKSPWKCPQLVGMNQAAEKARTNLTNVAVTGYAPMFHGFHAIVDKLVMKDDQPVPDFSAVIAIGSDNPASLLAMAGSVAPDIAKVGLKPDGVPKALPPMPGMPPNTPLFAAMTDKLIAVSIGAGEDAKLGAAMKLDDAHQPVLAYGLKGDALRTLSQLASKAPHASGDPDAQKLQQQSEKMMSAMADIIKRADVSLDLTEQGIELRESVDVQ